MTGPYSPIETLAAFGLGALLGALILWALSIRRTSSALAAAESERARRLELQHRVETAEAGVRDLDKRLAVAGEKEEQARRLLDEQREFLAKARGDLEDTFQALAAAALKGTSEQFLTLAQERLSKVRSEATSDLDKRRDAIESLLAPVREGLERIEGRTRQLEQARVEAYSRIDEQVRQLAEAAERLGDRTTSLTSALKGSQVRGSWGEIALRNVVEMAGMTEHCDFLEQETVEGGQRPDMLVRLPAGRFIAVDAKAPFSAFTEAAEATDDTTRKQALARHVRDLRAHVRALAARDYAAKIEGELDLVVLFLPGDPLLGAAITTEPRLLEESLRSRVLIATPTTLLALLRTVAIYWQQRELARNAQQIADVARELYDRAAKFGEELSGVGKGLQGAIDAYNRAVGSFDRRLMPMAGRLEELKAAEQSKRRLAAPEAIESTLREPVS
jgi:DNA recombination protein RmuC